MTNWHVSGAARTSRGLVRDWNSDGFFLHGQTFSPEEMDRGGRLKSETACAFQLYAVCDGVGEGESTRRAELETARMLQTLCDTYPCGIDDANLRYLTMRMSERLRRLNGEPGQPAGVTLAACLWQGGAVRVLNVGNSRVYRLRKGRLTQLSEDHTEVQRMVDLGMITPYQARVSPRRHVVNQYLGMDETVGVLEPYLSAPFEARPRDRFLLCSDGLTDMVEDEDIRRIALRSRDAAEAADRLTQQALDNGGLDNVTVLCLTAHGYRRTPRDRRG